MVGKMGVVQYNLVSNVAMQFNSMGDWVDWYQGDRFPYWTDDWRVTTCDSKGDVLFVGDYSGCVHYLRKTDSVLRDRPE